MFAIVLVGGAEIFSFFGKFFSLGLSNLYCTYSEKPFKEEVVVKNCSLVNLLNI